MSSDRFVVVQLRRGRNMCGVDRLYMVTRSVVLVEANEET